MFCASFVKPLNDFKNNFAAGIAVSGVTKYAFPTQLVHANNTIFVSFQVRKDCNTWYWSIFGVQVV